MAETFDVVFESYVKTLMQDAFMPFNYDFYYLNNFKPEYIDNTELNEKYIVLFNEGSLTRIHRDFNESGTKAYFLNFLTPVIKDENGVKLYKQQLDDLAENLRLENTEIQDIGGTPLFNVTTVVDDSDPVSKTTQNGVRYLMTIDVSCIYSSLQNEAGKLKPIREEQRKIEISLDNGTTFTEVKAKLQFQKSYATDLNIFPVNEQKLAQNYGKQRRKTFCLNVQRATTGIVEQLYQKYEDSETSLKNIRIRVQDYPSAPIRTWLCTLTQAIESGEYNKFNALTLTFEVKQLISKENGSD